ncbi:hypothetical protein MNB_SV-13-879 [hydrothermal vent metagenome]|uniref:Uncharacterized protein n=1 Tax=hydrothermal vent metagenome TaxID=652676 RepID=A0A1W1CWM9_9ZZZZ
MIKNNKEILECEIFLSAVKHKVKEEEISYFDAMQFVAMMQGSKIMKWVSTATSKYEEATYKVTELFKQANVDECALASMGTLWHGENFEGSSAYIESSEEEIILDSLYFILKYAESSQPLEDALFANKSICGDHERREVLIRKVFV